MLPFNYVRWGKIRECFRSSTCESGQYRFVLALHTFRGLLWYYPAEHADRSPLPGASSEWSHDLPHLGEILLRKTFFPFLLHFVISLLQSTGCRGQLSRAFEAEDAGSQPSTVQRYERTSFNPEILQRHLLTSLDQFLLAH